MQNDIWWMTHTQILLINSNIICFLCIGLHSPIPVFLPIIILLFLFNCSAVSNSLQSHGLQHTRLPSNAICISKILLFTKKKIKILKFLTWDSEESQALYPVSLIVTSRLITAFYHDGPLHLKSRTFFFTHNIGLFHILDDFNKVALLHLFLISTPLYQISPHKVVSILSR